MKYDMQMFYDSLLLIWIANMETNNIIGNIENGIQIMRGKGLKWKTCAQPQQLNHFDMKASELLSRLWDSTCYHVLAQPGRAEAATIMQMLQKTLEIYSVFHHSLQIHFAKANSQQLNIPVMQSFRDCMMESRQAVSVFLQEQAQKIGSLLHRQAEYVHILDSSEQQAKEEFTMKTYDILMKENLSARKLKSILENSRAASFEQNVKSSMFAPSAYERWCSSYSVRTQQFFLQVYSTKWQSTNPNFQSSRLRSLSSSGNPTPQVCNNSAIQAQVYMQNKVKAQNHDNSTQSGSRSSTSLIQSGSRPPIQSGSRPPIQSGSRPPIQSVSRLSPLAISDCYSNVFIEREQREDAIDEEHDIIKQIFEQIQQDVYI